jgi:hypothetical protein
LVVINILVAILFLLTLFYLNKLQFFPKTKYLYPIIVGGLLSLGWAIITWEILLPFAARGTENERKFVIYLFNWASMFRYYQISDFFWTILRIRFWTPSFTIAALSGSIAGWLIGYTFNNSQIKSTQISPKILGMLLKVIGCVVFLFGASYAIFGHAVQLAMNFFG